MKTFLKKFWCQILWRFSLRTSCRCAKDYRQTWRSLPRVTFLLKKLKARLWQEAEVVTMPSQQNRKSAKHVRDSVARKMWQGISCLRVRPIMTKMNNRICLSIVITSNIQAVHGLRKWNLLYKKSHDLRLKFLFSSKLWDLTHKKIKIFARENLKLFRFKDFFLYKNRMDLIALS